MCRAPGALPDRRTHRERLRLPAGRRLSALGRLCGLAKGFRVRKLLYLRWLPIRRGRDSLGDRWDRVPSHFRALSCFHRPRPSFRLRKSAIRVAPAPLLQIPRMNRLRHLPAHPPSTPSSAEPAREGSVLPINLSFELSRGRTLPRLSSPYFQQDNISRPTAG